MIILKFIRKVELINFQSHKHSILELDPYLNVIVGASDSGKSSIIRAIKWVLYNEPSGDFFIREGESEASVRIELNDGSKITRYRSKSKNSYIINYSNGEELVLNGFGVNVPSEVKDITGVDKVPFDQGNSQIVNISDQLEGPFLLSEKNSTKAFVIGGLAGVDIVDDAIGDLLKELRSLSVENKNLESNIEEINEKLGDFKSLDENKLIYDDLKLIYKEIRDREERLNKLKALYETIREIKSKKSIINENLDKLRNIDSVNNIYINLYDDLHLYKYYSNINKNMIVIYREKDESGKILNSLKNLPSLSVLMDKIENNQRLYIDLSRINTKYLEINKNKNILGKYLIDDSNIIDLEDYLKNIEELGNKLTYFKMKLEEYRDISNRLKIGREYVENFNQLDSTSNISRDLINIISKYDELTKIRTKLLDIKNTKTNLIKDYSIIRNRLNSQLDEYQAILLEAQVCPTCFSKINEDTIKNIIKEFS